jgi:hypothetical protein
MDLGIEMDDLGKLFTTFVDAVALILALVLHVGVLTTNLASLGFILS